jgi:hypothetical protein
MPRERRGVTTTADCQRAAFRAPPCEERAGGHVSVREQRRTRRLPGANAASGASNLTLREQQEPE